jgi:hypothetical protein
MIPFPQTEKLPSPVSEVWEDGAAGDILRDEVFAPLPPAAGFRSLALLGIGLGLLTASGFTLESANADQVERVSASATVATAAASTLTDQPERISAAVGTTATLNSALTDQPERGQASAAVAVVSAAILTDGAELLQATANSARPGFRSLALLGVGIGAVAGPPAAQFSSSLTDGVERLISTAGPGVLLTSINSTSAYRIESVPDLEVGDRIEVLSAVGGPATDVTILPDATFSLAPGSTVTQFDVRIWSISEQNWSGPVTQFVAAQIASARVDDAERIQATAGIAVALASVRTDETDQAQATVGAPSAQIAATVTDDAERITAATVAPVAAASALADQSDVMAASAAAQVVLASSLTDAIELMQAAFGAVAVSAIDAAMFDAAETLAASGSLPVTANATARDDLELVSASAIATTLVLNSTRADLAEFGVAALQNGLTLAKALRSVRVTPFYGVIVVAPSTRQLTVKARHDRDV